MEWVWRKGVRHTSFIARTNNGLDSLVWLGSIALHPLHNWFYFFIYAARCHKAYVRVKLFFPRNPRFVSPY